MAILDNDGDVTEVKGSGAKPYRLRNIGSVLDCSCPAWRNVGGPIDTRTCKHLIAVRGAEVERARVGDDRMPTKFRNGTSSAPSPRATPVARAAVQAAVQAAAVQPAADLAVLLANKWNPDVDPTGWLMSEKLDGVRAYWDGAQFLSRNGNVFHAPDWFRRHLPRSPLDGELWMGRQMFQSTISVVRRLDGGEAWRKVSYVVFDAPEHGGPFEGRLAHLDGWFSSARPPHASAHPHAPCLGADHLRRELDRVIAAGGEGLMLRQPGSAYERCRSSTLLKVKQFQDAEAVVIAHVAGKGKHRDRLGGLVVRTPEGREFNVGSGLTDAERESPPLVGATITYRFTEHTKDGIPKCASFVACRDYE